MLAMIWLLCGLAAAIVASHRGSSGCVWFGVGVLLGPIGFVLAFTTGRACPNCASRISTRAAICPQCGQALVAPARQVGPAAAAPHFCNACGAPVHSGSQFCPQCGQKLPPLELPG